MRSARRAVRAAAAAAVAAACVLALSGCLHTLPTSNLPDDPTSGRNLDTGDLAVRGLEVLLLADGAGAELLATIVNDGTQSDTLVSASIGGTPAQIEGDAEIAPGESLRLGDLAFSGGLRGAVTVSASGVEAVAGGTTTVVMSFAVAPAVTVQAYVRDSADDSEGSTGGGTESPAATPTGEETPSLPPTEAPAAPEAPTTEGTPSLPPAATPAPTP